MDHMRRDEIGAELEGYQHKLRIGFASVTVGDVVALISDNARHEDTIERLQKELKESKDWINSAVVACNKRGCSSLERRLRETDDLIDEFQKERDAALAEVERLKARAEKQADMIRVIDPLYR